MAIEITVDTPVLKGEKGDKGDTGSFDYGHLEDIVIEHLDGRFSDVDADLALKVDIDNDKDLVDKDIITGLAGLEGWIGNTVIITNEEGKNETKEKNLVNVLETKVDDDKLNIKFEVLETELKNKLDGELELSKSGDMRRSVYDPDGDNIVDIAKQADNADTVNNLTVETAVPENAVFTDTTYNEVSITEAGLMSSYDKMKLDGVARGATRVEVIDGLDSIDVNKALSAKQGKVLKSDINNINNHISILESEQKILWSGGSYMGDGVVVGFSEKINEQKNGIVLIWSEYDSEPQNSGFHYFYIPKKNYEGNQQSGHSIDMFLSNATFSTPAGKRLLITNTALTGSVLNTSTGTSVSGIKYYNNKYVLRAVLGV
ncbi:hypothetical protein ANASTE_00730 [Anaerofustis stercorihominis DSM 17244]|uniref:Uncharacterized protein n=1 Tax=Anaerofustis stercorihominis DSM 17244 TaxID=445971 RepID=B1C7M8_9FIRM|nr:hypothetical protein [Anaerofustis stercorihominis]EDS73015.1 hypothetical protein ANASTE_00730 [Anaerofustis stercorihominis DSM 17244]